jgi:hypothetical protein
MDLVSRELERMKHRRTRHHRQRIIEKRKRIILDCWEGEMFTSPGKLAKWNLSCNCWMCKGEKKMGIEKMKYREADYYRSG